MLEQVDVVVTNPPFSLIREFVNLLFTYNKEFLIIGPLNLVKYKDVFPYIKEGKLRMGVNGGCMKFIVPKGYKEEGYTKLNNIYWYTNMHVAEPPFLGLTETYKGNEGKYLKYDNYDAIEVSKVKDSYTGQYLKKYL